MAKKAAYNVILGEKAYDLENYETAATHFENALEILPDIKDISVPLGMCYFQINKFDRAIELFENVDLDLLDEDILNNLGAVCINSESFVLAEKYLLKAEEKKSCLSDTTKKLGIIISEKKPIK